MIRLLTVLFFVAFISAAAATEYASNCTALTCAKSGASCTGDFMQKNATFCAKQVLESKQPTGCCPVQQYCLTTGNSSSFTCMKDNSGAACTVDGDCWPNVYGTGVLNCISKVCTVVYGAGDSCSSSSDCYTGTCNSGICSGLAEGAECDQPSGVKFAVCAPGLYCAGKCMAPLAKGASCTSPMLGGEPCPAGQYCAGGKCLDYASVSSGGNCSGTDPQNTKFFSYTINTYLCASGLAANQSTGTCVSGQTWSLTSCTNNTDCSGISEMSKCECYANGKGYCDPIYNTTYPPMTNGASDVVSLINCIAKNNCSYDYLSPDAAAYVNNDPNSCVVKNCNSYLKKAEGATCTFSKTGGSCQYLPYCSGFPVWAIIVIVVVAVLLVLAVVFVIFLVLRKRRDYSSI